jgi:three-Cys-motif partner protein
MSRDWGPWTVIKLDALEKYMSAFTSASSRAKATLYLDLFGGRPDNRSRSEADDESEIFAGSALRAALVRPEFTKMIVTELSRTAAEEQRVRLAQVAGSRAVVVPGDCNKAMPEALRQLAAADDGWRWAPTFALVDQYSAEVTWKTLETLAKFKHPSARTKVELCIYVGPSFMVRGLRGRDGAVNSQYAARLDAMFGSRLWRYVIAAREDDAITGAQAEAELVNLMRWELEQRLGYNTTVPLQLRNTRGRHIFSMIFATDHPVGDKIMRSLFDGAEGAVEQMVKLSKVQRSLSRHEELGQSSFFDAPELVAMDDGAASERPTLGPPTEPFRHEWLWDADQ